MERDENMRSVNWLGNFESKKGRCCHTAQARYTDSIIRQD